MTQHREMLLREFWPEDPATWFKQTELIFRVNGITEEREKFEHALDAMTLLPANISDLVKKPPVDNAYTTLKSRVLAVVSVQQEETEEAKETVAAVRAPFLRFGVTTVTS